MAHPQTSPQSTPASLLHLHPPIHRAPAKDLLAPPRDLKAYADFLDGVLHRYGHHFEYVELWNEPNNQNDWDYRLDPGWGMFAEMMGKAAFWCRHLGFKTVLGGMSPTDPGWLHMLADRRVLELFDVVGIHGFPGTWDYHTQDWPSTVASVRQVLSERGHPAEVWITEAGYSTWRHDEVRQVRKLVDIMQAGVDRCYLYQLHDLHPSIAHQEGLREDIKRYHFGLKTHYGEPKLAYRLWQEAGHPRGLDHFLSSLGDQKGPAIARAKPTNAPVLITGGAGFVGTNLAASLCADGQPVLIFDNLSRPGVEANLTWLRQEYPKLVSVQIGDVRDPVAVAEAVAHAKQIYHLAAQVAVTTSLDRPDEDFAINAQGTHNILECARKGNVVPLLFTSTNKVYGELNGLELDLQRCRYAPANEWRDVGEETRLNFRSPYGCSKGAADQLVLDYAHTYNLPATVFRMSCIYGPHQWGTEDQGWVAHFVRAALRGDEVTIYGDGCQVRDVLFVEDLALAMRRALDLPQHSTGEAFNIGGGDQHTLSLKELVEFLDNELGLRLAVHYDDWRQADQRYYVSNISKARRLLEWQPTTSVEEGLRRLIRWMKQEPHIARLAPAAVTPRARVAS